MGVSAGFNEVRVHFNGQPVALFGDFQQVAQGGGDGDAVGQVNVATASGREMSPSSRMGMRMAMKVFTVPPEFLPSGWNV